MNTKPVDVLATLDKVAGKLDFFGYADLENHFESARVAIAELIAAIDEDEAAHEAFNKAGALTPDDFIRANQARSRLSAALARVKGEA